LSEQDFRQFVEDHYDRLFRAARFMCGDPEAAEDLVQDTFLAAGRSLERFEGRSAPYTWLYGILLNKFRRWLRRKRRRAVSLESLSDERGGPRPGGLIQAESPGPHEAAVRDETARQVRRAIGELSADHRAVIVLRFIEDMPYSEIARALDCPVGTVKSRVHYALRKMGRRLGGPQEGG
jgi:RNA polymerase sigma-70 factor (ECF subfamily)